MLEKLPIQLPQFTPEQWRSLEKQLIAIANREKLELEPRDRIVHKALPMVQYAAKSKQWTHVFNELRSRGIIELKRESAALLQFFTAQRMALCLTYKPVKVIKISLLTLFTFEYIGGWLVASKPEKPKPAPRVRIRKPKKSVAKKCKRIARKAKPLPRMRRLRFSLLSLSILYRIIDLLAYCQSIGLGKRGSPRRTSMEDALRRKNSKGFWCFEVKKGIKVADGVRKILVKWSHPIRKPAQHLLKQSSKVGQQRIITKEMVDQCLNNNWQPTGAIARKLSELLNRDVPFLEAKRMLDRRFALGEVIKNKAFDYPIALFTLNPDAVHIERDWISLAEAYNLARQRGCTCSLNVFRKNWEFKYHRFGLEFRKEVPVYENPLLRWRSIN